MEAGTEAETLEEQDSLLACSLGFPECFRKQPRSLSRPQWAGPSQANHQPRTMCPGVVPPTVGGTPLKPIINQESAPQSCYRGRLSFEVRSSQVTLLVFTWHN